MPFTAMAFGRKLSALRTGLGQDVSMLARSSGISPDRLGLLEGGEAQPTGDEVLILADRLKKDFRYFLSDDAADQDSDIQILFRQHGGDLPPSDRMAIAEFVYLCRSQAFLERALNRVPPRPGFRFELSGPYFKGHGQTCAARLREHLGLSGNEVVRDVFGAMRSMGYKVFRRRLENSSISGLFLDHPDAGPCVLVNMTEGQARQRFSAAHEWGHGLMDGGSMTFSTVGEWTSGELVEIRANTFAGDFLIPPARLTSLNERWTEPRVVSDWAERLRVSVPALLAALVSAKLIDRDQREALRPIVARPPEPPDPELEGDFTPAQLARKQLLLERGLSQSFVDLCFDGFGQHAISFGRLAEMLLTSAAGVHEVAELFGRSSHRND